MVRKLLVVLAIAALIPLAAVKSAAAAQCDPKDPKCQPGGGGGGGNGGPPPEVCAMLYHQAKLGHLPFEVWNQICGKKPEPPK
jgi:hypothetical protein